MAIHLLTPRQVQTTADGDHADRGGVSVRVRADRARGLYRYTNAAGVQRAMGLRVVRLDSIAAAGKTLRAMRQAADRARKLLGSGIDPKLLSGLIDLHARIPETASRVKRNLRACAAQQ